MNIERYLTDHHQGTRHQIFQLLRQERVTVNDAVITGYAQVTAEDQVCVDGVAVTGRQPQYLLVNKPVGVVNDLTPTVAHSLGSLLNALDQQRGVAAITDLPKEAMGVVILSDDGHFLDDVQHQRWASTLAVQLTGTTVPTNLTNPAWQRPRVQVDKPRQRVTVTVETTTLVPAIAALGQLPNATGSVTRRAFGPVGLPQDLPVGAYRGMTATDIDALVTSPETTTETALD